jgi:predicted Zn-dependent peptidase
MNVRKPPMITMTTLDCGATLVVQEMASVGSISLRVTIPAGSSTDQRGGIGVSTLLAESFFRGTTVSTSRQLSDALDRLGVQRSCDIGVDSIQIDATMLSSRLQESLPVLLPVILEPRFDREDLESSRRLAIQTLDALDDDPNHLAMMRLRSRHHPSPLNRSGYGESSDLHSVTIDDVQDRWQQRCVPGGAIIVVAGNVTHGDVEATLNPLTAQWTGAAVPLEPSEPPTRGVTHITKETAQVHLGIATDAPSAGDPDAILERVCTTIFGGSSSGRLFTHVRQERSLCYSVGSSYGPGRRIGTCVIYAGTTPERADETLEVCLEQLERMREGIDADEFARGVIATRARIVLQGESTSARTAAMAGDVHALGHPRSLSDLLSLLDGVTHDDVNAYLRRRDLGRVTIASVGPTPLSTPAAC